MSKENLQNNIEEENPQDAEIISKLQLLRKEIIAPREGFLKAMEALEPKDRFEEIVISKPTPFYQLAFFRFSVPALLVLLIVGFSVQNNFNKDVDTFSSLPASENPEADVNTFSLKTQDSSESANSAMLAPEASMMKSAPENSSASSQDLKDISGSEFSNYSNSEDQKFASYDEPQMTSFVDYYEENF